MFMLTIARLNREIAVARLRARQIDALAFVSSRRPPRATVLPAP